MEVLLHCGRVKGDSIYQKQSFLPYGPFPFPLAGNDHTSWFYNQSEDEFKIGAFTFEGDTLYRTNYKSSGNDLIKGATIAYDESLVVLVQTNGNDEDFDLNKGGQDIWILKLDNGLNVSPIIEVKDTITICATDSLLICPFIDGCFDCTYLWGDGINQIERWVSADSSRNFSLNISNSEGLDSSVNVFLNVIPLPEMNVLVQTDSDCPGARQEIIFEDINCSNCEIIYNEAVLDSNSISVFPNEDVILNFQIRDNSCVNNLGVPIDVYDFSAQIVTTICADSNNTIEVIPEGGSGEILIQWEDGNQEFFRTNLDEGNYSFILSDSLCTLSDTSQIDFDFRQLQFDQTEPGFFLKDEEGNKYHIDVNSYEDEQMFSVYDYFLVKSDAVGRIVNSVFIHTIGYQEYCTIRWFNGNIRYEHRDGIYKEFDKMLNPISDNLEIKVFQKVVIKTIGQDTIWTRNFSNIPWHIIYSPDSTQILVCGSEFLVLLDEETGETIKEASIGGSGDDNFSHAIFEEDKIVVLVYTNSIDGDLQGINHTDSSRLWLFETDLDLKVQKSYAVLPPSDRSFFYSRFSKVHRFKDGGILSDLQDTYRFNAEGEILWAYPESYSYYIGDTLFFKDGSVITDNYEYNGIRIDSLNIDQDSSTTVITTPGSDIIWSTGDTTSTITVTDPGTYTVEITSPDGCITNDTIIVFARSVSNENVFQEEHIIQVYPNPSNGYFTIESESAINHIEIFNVMGRRIMDIDFSLGTFKENIQLPNRSKGMYLMKCRVENRWINKKVIIQ